jgi:hypothetical protein
MAGLPAMSIEEESAHQAQTFSLGDASAQDESDGRQSWYIEAFTADGHYSVVLYSDGHADIVEGSGPEISVNSPLGQKMIDAAHKHVGVDKTFKLEGVETIPSSHDGETLSESHTKISSFADLIADLKAKIEKNQNATVNVKYVKPNVVAYSFS